MKLAAGSANVKETTTATIDSWEAGNDGYKSTTISQHVGGVYVISPKFRITI
jgi:hypothetical protein